MKHDASGRSALGVDLVFKRGATKSMGWIRDESGQLIGYGVLMTRRHGGQPEALANHSCDVVSEALIQVLGVSIGCKRHLRPYATEKRR
jgi:hypothetical protein